MSAARDLDVVVVGEINVDIVVTGLAGPPEFGAERLVEGITLTAGASGILTATGLAALGLRVGYCGMVGDDRFGAFMLEHLDRCGIDRSGVVVDQNARTGAAVLLSTAQDRAILTDPGAMTQFGLDRVNFDLVARARHLHLPSYFLQTELQPGVPALLARAHALGLTTSADTGHDPDERWEVAPLLDNVDVFLPNAVEAAAIAGAASPDAALEWFAGRLPLVAVKRGAEGAVAARGAERAQARGFPVTVRDTTGAGDAFDAGFLAAWLEGQNLAACLRQGNACGAFTAAHVGGTGAFDREQVDALLAAQPPSAAM